MWRHDFVVQGEGTFPIDMLRYDSCHPKTSNDVVRMANLPTTHRGAMNMRQITLTTYSARKDEANVSPERWKSFQWQVVRFEGNPTKVT